MTKAPKTPDSRAKALAGMTKAELIKTTKALDKRQTALLNQVARLSVALDQWREPPTTAIKALDDGVAEAEADERRRVFGPFPWETK